MPRTQPSQQTQPPAVAAGILNTLWGWTDRNIVDLGRQMRLSYLPPLMVYLAAGIQSLTSIVGTFFIKDYLNLSAQFLAMLSFWLMLPWALKVPLGHLVDLIWKHKAGLVYLGAGLITCSLLIIIGLLSDPVGMRGVMPAEAWFVVSALLAPIGYVLQDVVADAMTVEAVPRVDEEGKPLAEEQRRVGHTTMQTLGRVAIIGGAFVVSLVNVAMFSGVESMSPTEKVAVYIQIYQLALIIPVVSVAGTVLASFLRRRDARRLRARGLSRDEIQTLLHGNLGGTEVNWWILGGGLVFAVFSIAMGLSRLPFNQEIIFSGSMGIVVFLMWRLVRELEPDARATLVGTAIVIFVFRAATLLSPGPGVSWWMIDVLGFDQQFLAKLGALSSGLTLLGLFLFRRFVAIRSIAYVVGFLTIAQALLALPMIGMYYGLHHWTAAHTGGIVDQHFIALIDTAVASPLEQVSMIPMLAWIANSAPDKLKATYFAVMASFTNLALSLASLGTKYLNTIFTVTREVKDPVTGAVTAAANYSQLGDLLVVVLIIGIALPMTAILFARLTRFRSA
jgi:BT1 family